MATNVALPAGFVLEQPESAAPVALPQGFVLEQAAPVALPQQKPSLLDRARRVYGKREQKLQDIALNPNITEAERYFTAGSQVGGGVVEGAFGYAGDAIGAAYSNLPQVLRSDVSQAGENIAKSPVVQEGLQWLSKGVEAYQQWANANPRKAAMVESTVEYTGFAPTIKAGQVAANVGTDIAKTAPKVITGGEKLPINPIFSDVGEDYAVKQLGQKVTGLASQRKAEYGQLFDEAQELGKEAFIQGQTSASIIPRLRFAKEKAIAQKDKDIFDDAIKAIFNLQKGQGAVLDVAGKPISAGKISLNELEGLRRGLGVGYGDGGVRRVFDDVINQAIDSGDLAGKVEAGTKWREARKAFQNYQDTFDNPEKLSLIKKVVDKDLTPERLSADLFGAGGIKSARDAAARYDEFVSVLGKEAEPDLKRAIVSKIFNFADEPAKDAKENQVWLQRVAREVQSMRNSNKTLWNKFSPDEKKALEKMAFEAQKSAEGGLINKAANAVFTLGNNTFGSIGLKTNLRLPSSVAPKQIAPVEKVIDKSRMREGQNLKERTGEFLKDQRGAISFGDEIIDGIDQLPPPDKTKIRLYRGLEQEFDPKFDATKSDAPAGYSTWTDNPALAKQYAGERGFVYYTDLPKDKMGIDLIDKDGERSLFVNNKKPAGLNNVSGDEYLIYTDHDAYDFKQIKKAHQGSKPLRIDIKTPMGTDTASRMQRAREMGFDVDNPVYHGTDRPVKEFDLNQAGKSTKARSAKEGVWLVNDPRTAAGYAELAEQRPVQELMDASYAAERQNNYNLAERLMLEAEELENAGGRGGNIIKAYVRGKIKTVDMEDIKYDPEDVDLYKYVKEAKEQGFDGLRLINFSDEAGYGEYNPAKHLIVFDPKNIRSVHAKFDPAKKDSANLLASPTAVGLGAAGLAATQTQENK